MRIAMFIAIVSILNTSAMAQGSSIRASDGVEVLRLNSLALNQFDVLIRFTSVADKGEIGFTHQRRYVRLVFDRPSQKATQVTTGRVKDIGIDQQGNTQSAQFELLLAANVHNATGGLRRLPNPTVTQTFHDFRDATTALEFWTFDFLSVFEYPLQRGARMTDPQIKRQEEADDLWARQKLRYEKAKRFERRNALQLSWDLGEDSIDHVELDMTTLLPNRFWATRGSKNKLAITQRFEWIEIDGVMLPNRISEDRPKRYRLPDLSYLDYEENTTYEFHWISVNKTVDEKLLSAAILEVPQEFKLITDPASLGALELVDVK